MKKEQKKKPLTLSEKVDQNAHLIALILKKLDLYDELIKLNGEQLNYLISKMSKL